MIKLRYPTLAHAYVDGRTCPFNYEVIIPQYGFSRRLELEEWLSKNGIIYRFYWKSNSKDVHYQFINEEDALFFELRWK